MSAFLAAEHIVVRREGRSQDILERFLDRRKMRRKVAMYTSNVLSVPFIVMDTQFVATLPYAVVTRFVSLTSQVAAALPPFDLTYDLKLHWHRRFDNEPRSIWLREQLAADLQGSPLASTAGGPGAVSRVVSMQCQERAGSLIAEPERERIIMKRVNRTFVVAASAAMLLVAIGHAQVPQGGRGGAPVGGGRGGAPALPPLMQTAPKPAIANAKAVRSCESLASVALPNTTIESAAVDPSNPGVCRVTAITTHPPMGDKVRIWVAIPTANWNGRFLGNGGGGFVGGNAAGVEPAGGAGASRPARPTPDTRAAAAASRSMPTAV